MAHLKAMVMKFLNLAATPEILDIDHSQYQSRDHDHHLKILHAPNTHFYYLLTHTSLHPHEVARGILYSEYRYEVM
jgi:hypothetical protein